MLLPLFNNLPPVFVEYAQTYQQSYRVADDAEAEYELYVGVDQMPDFTAAPAATSASLPFTWSPTPPGAGTDVLYLVVRYKNAYGLRSFNIWPTKIEIDTLGDLVLNKITPPINVQVYDNVTGYLNVVATYLKDDDLSPADAWEIYAENGIDPIPGTDTPVATPTMVFFGDYAELQTIIGPFTPGDTMHVSVTAKRTSDSERGNSAVVQKTLIQPIDLTDASLFGGNVFEQK